eukprot:scpid89157/ scgid34132/ 
MVQNDNDILKYMYMQQDVHTTSTWNHECRFVMSLSRQNQSEQVHTLTLFHLVNITVSPTIADWAMNTSTITQQSGRLVTWRTSDGINTASFLDIFFTIIEAYFSFQ